MNKRILITLVVAGILFAFLSQVIAASPTGRVVYRASAFFENHPNPCIPGEQLTNVSGSVQMIRWPVENGYLWYVNPATPITAIGSSSGDLYYFPGAFNNVVEHGVSYQHTGTMVRYGSNEFSNFSYVTQVNTAASGPELSLSIQEVRCH
jgi:hypothetical protein